MHEEPPRNEARYPDKKMMQVVTLLLFVGIDCVRSVRCTMLENE